MISKRTVLLWGSAWWIAGRNGPVSFSRPAQAASSLAGALADEASVLRLIYEPEGFASIPTDCPKADKATLSFALSDRHPELAKAGIAWSHEPIVAQGETFGTLLHLEAKPELFALVRELNELGVVVQGAWPLPTWLAAVPPQLSESGAFLVAAFQRESACLFRHAQDGTRSIERWHGPETLERLRDYLRDTLNKSPAESVLLIPADEIVLGEASAGVALGEQAAVSALGLVEALGNEVTIAVRHPAQLLPPRALLTGGNMVAATAALLTVAAMGFAASHGAEYRAAQRTVLAQSVEKSQLRTELSHLRANAFEIAGLERRIAGLPASAPTAAVFALLARLPADLALSTVEVTARGFTAAGWIAPGSSAMEPWLKQLRAARPGWNIQADPPSASGIFHVHGIFSL